MRTTKVFRKFLMTTAEERLKLLMLIRCITAAASVRCRRRAFLGEERVRPARLRGNSQCISSIYTADIKLWAPVGARF